MSGKNKRKRSSLFPHIGGPVRCPSGSTILYKHIMLENGLPVLLVSDSTASMSAAAMTVRVGSFFDPPEAQGLSHLLEHMVFSPMRDFLTKHGGEENATTEMEHTTFSIAVDNPYLEESLGMFAKLFTPPLEMSIKSIESEIVTIDSEFERSRQNDECRLEQLMAHTCPIGHPFHRFTWGNNLSFSKDVTKKSLKKLLLKLFNEHFRASSMHLVVLGEDPLDFLQSWVDNHFSQITKGTSPSIPKSNPTVKPWSSDILHELESVGQKHGMLISWMIPQLSHETYMKRPENIIVQLLSDETKGSLFSFFKENEWVTKLDVTVGSNRSFTVDNGETSYSSTSMGRIFTIFLQLTSDGLEKKYNIISYIYQYLQLVRDRSLPQHVKTEYLFGLKMKFQSLDIDQTLVNDPRLFVNRLAGNMLACPVEHALSLDYMDEECSDQAIKKLLEYFDPELMRVDLLSKPFEAKVYQTEPWFEFRYTEEKIPHSVKETWKKIPAVHSSLRFPEKNEFMPTNFFIRNHFIEDNEDNEDNEAYDNSEDEDNYEDNEEYDNSEDEYNCEDEDNYEKHIEDTVEEEESFEDVVDVEFTYLVDEPGKKLFHRLSRGIAAAFFCVEMKVGSNVKDHMMTALFVELLNDELSEIRYKGTEAYLNTSLSLRDDNRLELTFDGYREKFHLFIKTIWEKFRCFLPSLKRFKIIKETMVRDFYSELLDLSQHSEQLESEEILKGCHTTDKKLEALKTITSDDLLEFIPLLRSKICIKGICFGDLLEEEVKLISEVVVVPEIPQELRGNEERIRTSRLGKGVRRINAVPLNKSETNSLAKVYFQMPCELDELSRVTAFLHLFHAIMEEKVPQQLREEERLGYDVECRLDKLRAIKGWSVVVVSSLYKPEYLLCRIYKFIAGIGDLLKEVKENVFSGYKNTVLSTLPSEGSALFLWDLIAEDCLQDGLHLKLSESLRMMKKKDVIELYQKYFIQSSDSCSRLEVCITGWGDKKD